MIRSAIRTTLVAFVGAALAFAASGVCAQATLWTKLAGNLHAATSVYGTPFPRLLAVDGNGNAFVAAQADTGSGSCFVTRKFGADGSLQWDKSICNGGIGNAALSVAVDARGDAIVTGTIATTYNSALGKYESDFRTVKYSGATGAVLWERSFSGVGPAGSSFDFGQLVVLDSAGNAYVMGSTFDGLYYMLEVIKYDGASGVTLWDNHAQVAGNYLVAGAGLDPQGNLIVGSQIYASDGTNSNAAPEIIKFSGQTGVMLWRHRGTSDVRMTALVVDPSGSPVAAYARGSGTNRDIYLEKYANSTGSVAWAGSWIGVGDDIPNALATDAAGNIALAASGSNLYTVLKYTPNGERQWQSTFANPGNAAWANGVAFDPSGDVLATGAAYDSSGYYSQRTTRHASATGSVVWESNIGGGSRHEDNGLRVVAAAGAVYVVGPYNDVANFDSGLRVTKIGAAAAAAADVNVHGLWWAKPAASESGWGVNLTQQGEKLFATWFTYDTDGNGLWLVMSDGVRSGTNTWTGALHRTSGPSLTAFDASNASQVTYQQVGTATFSFTDANNGTFSYTVNGVSQSKPITRFVYASPVPDCALGASPGSANNYQDIWWRSPAGSEGGWGVNLTHQGDILFATWFTYAPDGRDMWLVASNVNRVSDRIYSGPLYRTTGPVFSATPWNGSGVGYQQVGTITFTFSDRSNGVMDYTVNGVAQSKPITRYVFALPVTVCR